MNRKINRKLILELRVHSNKVAHQISSNSFDYTLDGLPIRITAPMCQSGE